VGNVFAQGLLDGTEKVDDVVVLTQAQGRDVAPLLAALPKPPRLWVIGHPAFDQPPAIAAPLANAPATPGPVVCLARFAHQKNHLGLLWVCDAVRRAEPAVRFDFYGEGPTKADVQAQVRVMGLQQQVGLHGFCTQPGRVLAQASVAVLGSRFEGFSLFCLEALAHGVPVVAFDVDYGPGELIENGVNGYLLPAGDTVGFAQAVLRLWRDADLRARMSAAAQASAARFAPQSLAQRWQELLWVERNASMDKTAIATPHLDSQGPGWRDWVLANLLRGCAPLGMVEPMLQGGWTQDAAAHALDEALAFLALPGDWRAKKS
jgi:glycosyltransferase involved in cell wall biosynthesis